MMNVETSTANSRQERMRCLLTEKFNPVYLAVENESPNHHVPEHSETHFKVILVSEAFQTLSLVKRHKLVYQCLNSEFQEGLHALSLLLFSPEEWSSEGTQVPDSPRCRGGHQRSSQ